MIKKTTQSPQKSRKEPNSYLSLYKSYATYNNESNLTKVEYTFIVRTFFFLLSKAMIYQAKSFVLPSKLGVIGIRKVPTHGRGYFDYQLYRKTGIKRYLKNNHSEQLVARVYWHQPYSKMRDTLVCLFKLVPSRIFSRGIAKHIKDNNAITLYYDK